MGKPKGKSSAYTYFVQSERKNFELSNPGQKVVFADFMKECGAKWKQVADQDKVTFVELAAEDRVRYDREMEDYVPEAGDEKKAKKRKVIKDPNAPKRPQSAFFIFSGEKRTSIKAELPEGTKWSEVARRLGELWGEMSTLDKQLYQEKAEILKAEYYVAVDEYKKQSIKLSVAIDVQDAESKKPKDEIIEIKEITESTES